MVVKILIVAPLNYLLKWLIINLLQVTVLMVLVGCWYEVICCYKDSHVTSEELP